MLSRTSQYALRALACLARLPQGSSILGRDLARTSAVPANYLAKILLSLRNAGLVHAARGCGGGYSLLRPASAIYLIEVVQLFEGPAVEPACLLGVNEECSHAHPCTAHASWQAVRSTYVEFLEQTTLDDIAHSRVRPLRHAAGGGLL